MQCGGCGTIIDSGQLTCPNCGRMVWSRGSGKTRSPQKPAPLANPSDSSAHVELELSETADDIQPEPKPAAARRPAPAPAMPTLDADGVRGLLAENPGLLEPGMEMLVEKGKSVGASYPTDVGPIDLLLRDASGLLVVVTVAKGDEGTDLIAEILQRIGWVRKHVAKTREGVRGLVLLQSVPESLSYAAAAVADTVGFRTFQISLRFDEVEI